jgi:RNA polymerase sigma-70 factor (ECF subfamily)
VEQSAMKLVDEGSTNSTLLRQVADWQNDSAWFEFRERYDPLLRRRCRSYGLDGDATEEVCQLVWIELADRMTSFCYDPHGSFRALLGQVCEWRVFDFLRRRRAEPLVNLGDRDGELTAAESLTASDSPIASDVDATAALGPFFVRDEAEKAQAAVKARVNPRSWDAFWLVAIQGWTVEETASSLEMTRIAVYAARARVARMLADEGKSVLSRRRADA